MSRKPLSELAVLGGTPLCSEPLRAPAWPPLSERTADRLREVYLSQQWSFNSPAEQEFERAYADYHGAKHGVFMVNGTVTLQCALGAVGVGPGDEVILPALTWMATAMAVHYVGATPVFVDLDPDTLCLDPGKAREAVTERTRAIIPVHLYGSTADLDAILDLAREHDLKVIEDCAHMQGGKWRSRGVGSWGDVGSFSFQQSKTLASGEGGICLTNDDALAERLYRQKHIGYGRGLAQGEVDAGPPPDLMCYNFRGNASHATILHDQLDGLAALISRYEQTAGKLRERLADVPGVRLQARGRKASPQGYYALVFLFDEGPLKEIPGEVIREAIAAEGLRIGGTYGPVYRHRLYNMPPERYRIHGGVCPVAETTAADRAAPLAHQWLSADDSVIECIGDILGKVGRNADTLREHAAKA